MNTFEIRDGRAYIDKAPGASKVYRFDWSDWLGAGVSIATASLAVEGVTATETKDATGVNVMVAAGELLQFGTVECTITTDEATPQTDTRTMVFHIVQ